MEHYYIIDTKQAFTGNCLNTMPFVDHDKISTTLVHYSEKTFAEYNQEKGGGLVALDWGQVYEQYFKPYNESLQKTFSEITEESFNDSFNCLPPMRYTRINEGFLFFVSECYTADLYLCCITYKGKYYSALRSKFAKIEDLINEITNKN